LPIWSTAPRCPRCQGAMETALVQYLKQGERRRETPRASVLRESVLAQVAALAEIGSGPEKVD
ncbi:MAG: hypothetical protein R3291_01630, partial [Thermoplasmata archaeon]|nr:hypothetical protein [Thermoplasmata archaeon]